MVTGIFELKFCEKELQIYSCTEINLNNYLRKLKNEYQFNT